MSDENAELLPAEIFATLTRLSDLAKKLTAEGIPTTVSASLEMNLKSGQVRIDLKNGEQK